MAAKTDPKDPAIAPKVRPFAEAAPVKTAGVVFAVVAVMTAGVTVAPPAPPAPPAGVVTMTVGEPGQAVQVTAVVVKPVGTPDGIGVVPVAVAVMV